MSKIQGSVSAMSEALEMITKLRSMGATMVKVGGVEVQFDATSGDMMGVLENGIQQGRQEILSKLSAEQKAQVDQMIDDEAMYGS